MTDAADLGAAGIGWTVLLPVKVLARAKSRLAVLAGPRRRELALALASDTVSAVVACPEVARVIVVTSDRLAGPRLAALGALVVADIVADQQDAGLDGPGGASAALLPGTRNRADIGAIGADVGADIVSQDALNAALRHGAAIAARRWPGTGLAALTADLPALRPAELGAALRAAGEVTAGTGAGGTAGQGAARSAFVPDAAGVGTTLYAVVPGGEFRPDFGGASRMRHAAGGAIELALDDAPGIRQDVDTPADLRAAIALGAGHRTTALAAELLAHRP
jgi:2-phospho-L-lactate/phosphoenolpyruvate guanylyltransferase